MAELIRTNDVALISVVEAVLKEADLPTSSRTGTPA